MSNEEYKPLPELVAPTEREVKPQSYKPNSIEDDLRSMFSLSTHGCDKDSYKLVDEITLLKQEKEMLEHQIKTNNQTMTSLENENRTHRTLLTQQSQKLDSSKATSQNLEKENQALKQANKTLEKQLKTHDSANVETLTKLLETKSNEIELIKQNMQLLLDQEKQRSSRLEKENRKLKRQLSGSTRNSLDDDDPNNDINYDSEVESHGSDNDINYDTPVEEDNNDLNYDSDEQTSNYNKKKTATA
jgi:chromosome segregation ATPase